METTETKSKFKRAMTAAKDHVKRQKFAYLFAGTSALLLTGSIRSGRQIDEFLTEKGIDPAEYWLGPEDFEEAQEENS